MPPSAFLKSASRVCGGQASGDNQHVIVFVALAVAAVSVGAWWVILELHWRRALAAEAQAIRDERAADIAWMDGIERRAREEVERRFG